MNEKILDALKSLGFQLQMLDDGCCQFEYEGKHILYLPCEDDEQFLNLSIPGIMEMDEEDSIEYYQIMDYANKTLKYVKFCKIKTGIWIFYERELFENDDLKQVISHMILRLDLGYELIQDAVKESCSDEDTDENDIQDDTNNDDAINDGGDENE